MKATINGIEVEGTPAEIAEFWSSMQPAREDSEDRKAMQEPMQQSEARCFSQRKWIRTHLGGNTITPQQHQNDLYARNGPVPNTAYCENGGE